MIGKIDFRKAIPFLILLLMVISGFAGCKTPSLTQQAPMKTYYYTDGMSNTYLLTSDSLKYDPIKPENSSSGVADGGEKKAVALKKNQFEALEALANSALADEGNHLKTRLMGCGTLTLVDATGEETVFIKMNAESKDRLEEALKYLLK